MTIKEIKRRFLMSSFGCADNPSCYVMQATFFVEKICSVVGMSEKAKNEAVRDMLGDIKEHIQKKLNGDKIVRIVFVQDWVERNLLKGRC